MKELKYEVKVMCKNRYVVPEVMQKMVGMGFSKIKEVFNEPASDINSIYIGKDPKDMENTLNKLARENKGYVSQISSELYRSFLSRLFFE